MKIVFSRKGFDSGWGGKPSPILPDGRLVSLPIPDLDGIPYTELRLDGHSYGDLMAELGIKAVRYPGKGTISLEEARAHLDPDLNASVVPRLAGWRPLFGQVGPAQGHLRRQGIGAGDLFLFYGLFRPVVRASEGLRYANASQNIQSLWGYLEVDEVITVADTSDTAPWAADHPHFALRDQPRFAKVNTVYAATERLSWDPSRPGGGTLGPFTDELRLTKPGATPSVWDLPIAFHPSRTTAPMTCHPATSWSIESDRATLRAARIGQEFVVEANEGIQVWIREIIGRSAELRSPARARSKIRLGPTSARQSPEPFASPALGLAVRDARPMPRRPGRSYERIEIADLQQLGKMAAEDRERFYTKHPQYRDRLLCVALCQGAAKHFVDMQNGLRDSNGVKDFDVWSFFAAIPGERFPADRRNVGVDFGPSKFGQREGEPHPRFRHFVGRNVDLLMRALPVPPSTDPTAALRDYLRGGRTKSAQELAAKAVVLIEPAPGTVVWPIRG